MPAKSKTKMQTYLTEASRKIMKLTVDDLEDEIVLKNQIYCESLHQCLNQTASQAEKMKILDKLQINSRPRPPMG